VTRRFFLFAACAPLVSPLLSRTLTTLAPAPDGAFVLEVEKTGIMAGKKHRFVFSGYHGEVSDSRQVNFTLRSASIRCEDTWVSEKDRAKILKYALTDMLHAKEYPEIRYVSTAVRESGKNSFAIDGNLTIGPTTRPVALSVARQNDNAAKSWWNGSGVLSLSDFGLKAPTAALGAVGTKDQMQLSFHLAAL
jgi:polyisoprenoid-binding protein YceI